MRRSACLALLAAILFGAGVPLSKKLLGAVPFTALGAFLYCGSGMALALAWAARRGHGESRLRRSDLPWLAASTAAGGVAAPLLLLWGLTKVAGLTASLLLNLEGVCTALLAGVIFREAVGLRVWIAAVLATGAGALLAAPQGSSTTPWGALAVAGACACWGLDNNLTRYLSGRDPVAIGCLKSLAAGLLMLAVSGFPSVPLPSLAAALGVGALSYGASLVCFVLALRGLGAARTAVLFGLAPVVGALVSWRALGEPLGPPALGAGALLAAAFWLLLGERHEHEHLHEETEHEHRHVHDGHHTHAHRGDEGPEPHAHPHRHERLLHRHPHGPDLHHRHPH